MMKSRIGMALQIIAASFLLCALARPALAQESGLPASATPSQVRQAIQSGQVSQQQVQQATEAMQGGDVSAEQMQQAREQAESGSVTPEEIQAGKELLEQQQKDGEAEETDAEAEPDAEDDAEDDIEEDPEKDKTVESPELRIFGHNLFAKSPDTFAPIESLPISDNYIIGPGDEIQVNMWGRMEQSHTLKVDNEGIIYFPRIGPIVVAGLTFGEIKDLIRRKAEAITGVNVSVSMGKLKTLQVFILGEVINPRIYTVSALSTVTNALLAAGGPTKLGSLRRVQLKRNERIVAVLDLYDLLLKGDVSADTTLTTGDVIYVPQAGPMVTLSGNVKRPAIYELKDVTALEKVIEMAGGLAPSAYNQRIQIERLVDHKEVIVLDISDEQFRMGRTIDLKDGDVVRIFEILPAAVNAVYLYGNVNRPGRYAYRHGLRIKDLLPDIDALKPDTYLDYALIKRYQFMEGQAELIPFNLGRLLTTGNARQNIPLMPGDELHVFNKQRFQDKRYADVRGQVRKPGRYAIDDMTLRDLILKAGGLTTDAYMPKAELIRYDQSRNRHTIYFDVSAVMSENASENIQVRHQDAIVIHSIFENQWKPSVAIKGRVNDAGEYTLTEGMRLRDLFFKAGSFKRDAYKPLGHLLRTDPRTHDATLHSFDIDKALAGSPRHNLLLKDQDEVTVHSVWDYKDKKSVSIDGFVRKPGDYRYAEGMTVNDLILLAGDVREAAYMDEAELIRFTIINGRKVETDVFTFNVLRAQENHPQHNLALDPMDMVTIKQIPDWWERKRTVTLSGEVYFPGEYQIRKDERLSSIIERAGGFTDYAYLRGAVFTRESVKKAQQQRLDDMLQELELEMARASSEEVQESLSEDDLAAQSEFIDAQKMLIQKLRESRATGRIIIKMVSLAGLRGTDADMVLKSGDALRVPGKMSTVNIMGAVYNPTAVLYDKSTPELAYYLERTGGPTENADEDLIYVVRSDGTVVSKTRERSWWRRFENIELYPGDTVLVPEKLVRANWMRDTKDITQILYQIATTAGVTAALF